MKKYYYLLATLVIWMGGCGGGGASSSSTPQQSVSYTNVEALKFDISTKKIDSNTQDSIVFDGSKSYITKTFTSSSSFNIDSKISSDIYVVLTNAKSISPSQDSLSNKILKTTSYAKVVDFRKNFNKYLIKEGNLSSFIYQRRAKSVGDSRIFYLDTQGVRITKTKLKLRRTVYTKFGNKTLNIYVSDDSFDDGSGCPKYYCVNQDMVDTLGDKFLKKGLDNDIYDWETNIYGEEWGDEASKKFPNLIGKTDEITILLTDIDNDNEPKEGAIGYFFAKDNMTDMEGSNKEIMFYIDSVMYANQGNVDFWDTTEKMPMEVISTLAHEFQHMISFYQKSILRGGGKPTSTWLDETMSCATEYLLSSKIKTRTPREVSYEDGSAGTSPISQGFFPVFNKYINDYTLTNWSSSPQQYGGAYAFGAYILQNYGGAKLLHNIMHNSYLDYNAILEGIRLSTNQTVSFEKLFNDCGVAILASNKILDPVTDKPYIFNTGNWNCQNYEDSIYCMGSINFFNYYPAPNTTTIDNGILYSNSNRYIYLKYNVLGSYNIYLNLGEGVIATVLIK